MRESHAPSRSSLPPPSLPRELVAQARVRTLLEEFASVTDARLQTLCAFELGALHEHGLREVGVAETHYRRAVALSPGFLPGLFALTRLCDHSRRQVEAAALWQAISEATRTPSLAAEALCEAGILHADTRNQRKRAVGLWNAALAADSGCRLALLLLEQDARASGDAEAIERILRAQAAAAHDLDEKAQWLLDLASQAERKGELKAALSWLAEAAGLETNDRTHETIWRETERVAKARGDQPRLRAALLALAECAQKAENATEGRDRAAALWLEIGRSALSAESGASDPAAALQAYTRGLSLRPDDVALRFERMLAHEALGDAQATAADAQTLLAGADGGPLSVALATHLFEALKAQGQHAAALALLETTAIAAPSSVAANSALETRLVETGAFSGLRDRLLVRARQADGEVRAKHVLRAGRIALLDLGDSEQGFALIEEALHSAPDSPWALGSRYGAARTARHAERVVAAIEALCQTPIAPDERAILRFDQYLHLLRRDDDQQAALRLLRVVLREPENALWANDAARTQGGKHRSYALLAQAHRALAASAGETERAAAHLCGAARASLRSLDSAAAIDALRKAVRFAPDDAYALALLQESLLASGASDEAAQVLREAAERHSQDKERGLALLHAGAAAEAAGDAAFAAQSYQEASGHDPFALGPRWALLRLAERRADAAVLERALGLLAERETLTGAEKVATLELGEHLQSRLLFSDARVYLAAALDDEALRTAAALGLCLLPDAALDAGLRDQARSALLAQSSEPVQRMWLRDTITLDLEQQPGRGRSRLDAALNEQPDDRWLLYHGLLAGQDSEHRVARLLSLARLCSDRGVAAELTLAAVRTAALSQDAENSAETLLAALSAAQEDPHSHALAVALDELLEPRDDPDARVAALHLLLMRGSPEFSHALRACHARALLSAGRASEAVEAARRALAHDDGDLAMWEVLRVASRATEDFESVVEAGLRLASAAQGPCCARLLEEVAQLLTHELGRDEEAERYLHAAFEQDPAALHAFAELHDRILDRGDLPALLALVERRLEGESDQAERTDLSYELALILRALGRLEVAAEVLEGLIADDAQHAGALGLMVEICTSLERWEAAVSGLRKLAQTSIPKAHRRLALLGAAEFLELHLHDRNAACEELLALRALGLADKDVLLRLGELCERLERFRPALDAYREAALLCTGSEAASIQRRCADLLHQRLGSASEAIAAYERALLADPLDATACEALLRLDDSLDARTRRLITFEKALRARVDRDPLAPWLLRLLRQLGRWRGHDDEQIIALSALSVLSVANEEERAALTELRNKLPSRADDAALSLLSLDPLWQDLTPGALSRIAELISLALAKRPSPPAATLASGQRFELGQRAMAQRRGVLPLFLLPRAARRDALLAGLMLGGRSLSLPHLEALSKELLKGLSRAERKELSRAVAALGRPELLIDEYLEAIELGCARAGLLWADDPSVALEAVLGTTEVEAETLITAPRALELLRFWMGTTLLDLRRQLARGAP